MRAAAAVKPSMQTRSCCTCGLKAESSSSEPCMRAAAVTGKLCACEFAMSPVTSHQSCVTSSSAVEAVLCLSDMEWRRRRRRKTCREYAVIFVIVCRHCVHCACMGHGKPCLSKAASPFAAARCIVLRQAGCAAEDLLARLARQRGGCAVDAVHSYRCVVAACTTQHWATNYCHTHTGLSLQSCWGLLLSLLGPAAEPAAETWKGR